ncbi:uncharacterized protein LOC124971240 isoform X3 [Sciurus carolinensis]|uniref:uncharacterized protein LOC124971240 isoform X3 n=1 Tax=Sciurus carolinensis TaxID=30640 RepID=UPI001FB29E02|nr:uncharacterized protein LOC124971240 isoform X3 [Sciurus carolinensis]
MEAQRHGRICFQASFQSRESRCPARGLQWQVDSVALEILYGWGQLSSNQSKGSCSGELYGTHNSPTAGRDFTSFVTKSQKSLFQPLDPRTSPELVGQDPGTFFRGCGSSPAGGKIWRTAKEASAEHRREPSEITTSGATAEHLKGQIARRAFAGPRGFPPRPTDESAIKSQTPSEARRGIRMCEGGWVRRSTTLKTKRLLAGVQKPHLPAEAACAIWRDMLEVGSGPFAQGQMVLLQKY